MLVPQHAPMHPRAAARAPQQGRSHQPIDDHRFPALPATTTTPARPNIFTPTAPSSARTDTSPMRQPHLLPMLFDGGGEPLNRHQPNCINRDTRRSCFKNSCIAHGQRRLDTQSLLAPRLVTEIFHSPSNTLIQRDLRSPTQYTLGFPVAQRRTRNVAKTGRIIGWRIRSADSFRNG